MYQTILSLRYVWPLDILFEINDTVINVYKKKEHSIESDQFRKEVPQSLSDWVPQALSEEYTLTNLALKTPHQYPCTWHTIFLLIAFVYY